MQDVDPGMVELFAAFDKNGDGVLDVNEFQQLMTHMMRQNRYGLGWSWAGLGWAGLG